MARDNRLNLKFEGKTSSSDRRGFLKTALLTIGLLALWPVRLARASKVAIGLDKVEKLKTVGGSLIIKIKEKEILFIRDTDESIRSLDPTCTHNRCQVAYNAEKKTIDCPCHGSRYDLEGKVLEGPAPAPLKKYDAYLDEEDRIVLTLEDEE